MDNKVSIVFTPAELQAIQDAIAVLESTLDSKLISLTVEERKELNKMGEASRPFVGKVTDYVQTNPEFISPFNKVDELLEDWTLIGQLGPLYNTLNQIVTNMDDTLMEAGAEVLEQANLYYGSVQQAVRVNMPHSKPVYDDLKVRYEKRSKRRGGDPAAA
ncbi:hypothetical protein [Algoriphagus vanfongensis]|uniref:hypothetical protein n=1 Tax=Algoriphagus vanfongensis TaxID=426371 RepID=UPI0004202C7F|nr:hypothetical protein [Algoriphagus vanfongensis]